MDRAPIVAFDSGADLGLGPARQDRTVAIDQMVVGGRRFRTRRDRRSMYSKPWGRPRRRSDQPRIPRWSVRGYVRPPWRASWRRRRDRPRCARASAPRHSAGSLARRARVTRGSNYWFFTYRVSVQILDMAFREIWTWLLPISMSGFWKWVGAGFGVERQFRLRRKLGLEAEKVPGRLPPVGALGVASLPADQPGLFQLVEVHVQTGAGDFGIGRQLVLRREAPVVRVVPIAEMPEDELGRRRQPALLDRLVGGSMAHSAAVTVRRRTIASISAIRRCASS